MSEAPGPIEDNRAAALEYLKDAGVNLADMTWAESCQIQAMQGIGYALLDVADAIHEQTEALHLGGIRDDLADIAHAARKPRRDG